MIRKIWVTADFRALHRWEGCHIAEVDYLREWHRHCFKVKVTCPVAHSDRDLEFMMVQKVLREVIHDYEGQHVDMSCEMFAEDIRRHMNTVIGREVVESVEVSEDGENGAIVSWDLAPVYQDMANATV